jgi:hypothetical protein
VAAVKARKTNNVCASMNNAEGVDPADPYSLSKARNAARPRPVGFAFYPLFSGLKRYLV